MRKTLKIGQCDWNKLKSGTPNEIEIELGLEDSTLGPVFTCSGIVWNAKKKSPTRYGTDFREVIKEASKIDPKISELEVLWAKYNDNDRHLGTEEQEAVLAPYGPIGYDDAVKVLKEAKLFEVQIDGEAYKYGSGFIYKEIPAEDLKKIKAFFKWEAPVKA